MIKMITSHNKKVQINQLILENQFKMKKLSKIQKSEIQISKINQMIKNQIKINHKILKILKILKTHLRMKNNNPK